MKYSETYLRRVASALVSSLLQKNLIRLSGEVKTVEEKVADVLIEHFHQEENLEKEAERLAARHAHEMQGVDRRKMILLIKQRLAKERGVVL